MAADDVAKAFIPHYYNLFDTNREGLVSLFRDTTSLTFEGDGPKVGPAAIMEKLRAMPQVAHQPQTIETQNSIPGSNSILIFVTGKIMVEAGKPLAYAETFQLCASAPGQYFLNNIIFRFIYS
mmetsp:Transcript_29463/g.88115  ORF Transcript_29463/g.88115 Transcript_29463/m.88115 type:complete len:123 (-) Transcript_29463:36-404(-)